MSEKNTFSNIDKWFWGKIDKTDNCWNWLGQTNNCGYGQVKYYGKWVYVHRLSYEFHNGDIPSGMVVCHKCDNPQCVNPEHLFVGTQRDNIKDCATKGRWYLPVHWARNARG